MSCATVHGRPSSAESPSWEPLIDLVGLRLVGEFMWMFEILLEDGSVLHAYKHIETRRYLHLHEDGGRAFACVDAERYREIDPRIALRAVFADWERTAAEHEDRDAIRAALANAHARADRYAAGGLHE
jgi:hypothetical protein